MLSLDKMGKDTLENPLVSGQNIGPHDDDDDDDDDGQIAIEMKFTVLHICIFRK